MADGKPAGLWSDLITNVKRAVQSLNNLTTTLANVFPSSAGTTAPTATAGTNGAPPAQVAKYLNVSVGGQSFKVPLYNP